MNRIFLQKTIINKIQYRLKNFKWMPNGKANFSCPICGDSKDDDRKARGWLYPIAGTHNYKCFNDSTCARSFERFIELIEPELLAEYKLECVKEHSSVTRTAIKVPKDTFSGNIGINKKFKVSQLPNKVTQYLKSRRIPENQHKIFDYTRSFKDYVIDHYQYVDEEILERLQDARFPSDERLVIPYRTRDGKLFAFQGRALEKSHQRYITVKLTRHPKIFGLERNDPDKFTFVTEGPIDSLFIPNALALGGTGITKDIMEFSGLKPEKTIMIYDNEPRNSQIVKYISDAIDLGCGVVIWEGVDSRFKDINDMIIKMDLKRSDIIDMITSRTYRGPAAHLKLKHWSPRA